MKTTIELPETLFRRAKSMAAHEGVTLKQLLTEALESRLDAGTNLRDGKAARPKWMRAYGALQHLRHECKAIERAIESEFEKIDPEAFALTTNEHESVHSSEGMILPADHPPRRAGYE